jgi:hypothetical protein
MWASRRVGDEVDENGSKSRVTFADATGEFVRLEMGGCSFMGWVMCRGL